MHMSAKIHVGTSPLTGTIYAGRLCKDGQTWAGTPQEVTTAALVAVAEHVEQAGRPVVIRENGTPRWEIVVRNLTDGATGGAPK